MRSRFDKIRLVSTGMLKPLLPDPADPYFDSMRIRGIHRVLKSLERHDRLHIERVVNDPTNMLLPTDIWNC